LTLLRRAALALATLTLAIPAISARAEAYLYWGEPPPPRVPIPFGSIYRAGLDTTGAQSLTEAGMYPLGVAVDGAHIYWAGAANTIARSNLDGTGVNKSFITNPSPPPSSSVYGLAVDGAHVYWTSADAGTIGRANLDGTGVDQTFIAGASDPRGVAVDGAHVYWANFATGTIGRANLDGTGIDQSFIAGASDPRGVAVDGAHLYWGGTGIGRANLDGTGIDPSFIDLNVLGMAVDGAYLYWANVGNPASGSATLYDHASGIGRANLDGTGVDQCFMRSANTYGVAVDALGPPPSSDPAPPPSYEIGLGKAKRDKKRGLAELTVEVPVGPGELYLDKTNKVQGRHKGPVAGADEVTLLVKAGGEAKARLNKTGKVKVKAKVTYIPDCGPSDTESKKITLVKR
jgi:hypothetical protein